MLSMKLFAKKKPPKISKQKAKIVIVSQWRSLMEVRIIWFRV